MLGLPLPVKLRRGTQLLSACLFDCESCSVVMMSADEVAALLQFKQGIFPSILKHADIIPVYKSGDQQIPGNYRPISLTSQFAKLLEKCIFSRMDSFLSKYSIINKKQYGFRKGISTESAVSQIYNNYVEKIENKSSICSIFVDI